MTGVPEELTRSRQRKVIRLNDIIIIMGDCKD